MSHRHRFAFVVVLVVGFAVAALASNIAKSRVNVAVTTGRYCAGFQGAKLAVQCEFPVYLATGMKLSDGGTRRTTDAGAPIVPSTGDDLVAFPGDPYKVDLGPNEQCLGLLSQDAGDGGNLCNIAERNAP